MSRLSITPLGTNGFIPTHGRQTQCYLVRRDERAFVLDAGTGLGRLLEAPLADALRGLERLEIVLTHYHLDHTVGLSYLTAVAGSLPVRIHAPAPPLVDGTPEALSRLIAPPLFPLRFAEFPISVEVVPYHGTALEVAGAKLRLRRQEHAGGSVGVVIDDRLAYLTDCEAEEASAEFAGGVELLLHEVWVTDEEAAAGAQRRGHSTVERVAALASAAGAGTLMPMHHHPTRSSAELESMVARLGELSAARVVLPVEGREYALDGR
ncbi:MAG TPA: MBL fold metallo-hydrolase [Thermoanaerobaculia bacterium]|jgi:ribonuclease BN (tRNA processing enzyme)|nr:MBL fold metallo-hydrolase [Thermoanaerobaculia bacterium]